MTFKKTATAIIVASIFSLPLTVNAQIWVNNSLQEIDKAEAYWFGVGVSDITLSITGQNDAFGNYLIFGEAHGGNDKNLSLNLKVKNSTLNLNENIKLRTRTVISDSITAERPSATKFNLQFQDSSTLNGDIVNQYDSIRVTDRETFSIAAKGNNTTVSFDNKSHWNGNLVQTSASTKFEDPFWEESQQIHNNTVNLRNESTWTGSMMNLSQGTNTVNIDANSSWTVQSHSNVNELKSEGKVNLSEESHLIFNKGNSMVSNLTFDKGSQIQLTEGAKAEIGHITGQGNVHFVSLDNNSLKVNAAQSLNVVVDKSVNEKYGLDKTLNMLNAQLTTGSAVQGNFAIEQSLIGDGIFGNIAGDKLTVTGAAKNTNLIATSELVATQMMLWRAEADDLNQRMGELRDSTNANGLWVRTYGGKSEATMVDNEFVGFQFGYDSNVASGVNQQFVGGAISYTKGDASFSTGTGDNDTFAFTGYSTWLLDSGSYVDISAKYGKLNSDFDIKTGLGNLNGDYSTHGLAMGGEVGHRFPVTNLFYVEPQLAFTVSHIFGEDFGAGQGVTVEQDSINSYVARAGLVAGLKCPNNMGSVWMKASYLYDFDGETTTTARKGNMSNQFAQDFGGDWYELSLGASVNFTKNLHGYADFEYAAGAEIETPYKWNVGVRYTY